MRFLNTFLLFFSFIIVCSNAYSLETFYGDTVSIDSPVDDDIFAAGSIVKINAPVDSATVVGGALYVNAPVERDLIAAGGEVQIESDVGGKIMAAGGNINLGGDVGTNLVAAGGNVNLQPTANVARDALITAGRVLNAGNVNGTLTVRSNDFNNIGSAGEVDYQMIDNPQERPESQTGIHLFSLLTTLGWLILGLILLKFLPSLFNAVEREIIQSIAVKTGMGFVFIIALCIAILITAITIVGLPIAIISALSMIVALMLTGTFVSFSLGRWIGNRLKLQYSDMILFIIGFIVLNVLFILPLVGWLVSLISICLGFGAFLYAARKNLPKLSEKSILP